MPDRPTYWFPAKRYGWGWGIPTTWQGWVVIAVYVAFIAAGAVVISAASRPGFFAVYVLLLSVLLTAICWAKGAPPRWHWGERDGD